MTVAEAVLSPALLVAVRVYTVFAVIFDGYTVPVNPTTPILLFIETLSAPLTFQVSVIYEPEEMIGVALKLFITG